MMARGSFGEVRDLVIKPFATGALVEFPPGRSWAFYRAFRLHFRKARPSANWTWFVPGPTAATRVAKWQESILCQEAIAERRAREEAADREWEAAAPTLARACLLVLTLALSGCSEAEPEQETSCRTICLREAAVPSPAPGLPRKPACVETIKVCMKTPRGGEK